MAVDQDITQLREKVRLLEWRARRAEDFLDGYSAAPDCAKSVLSGNYDYEFTDGPSGQKGAGAAAYCKCPFTDPDGTVVPGEPCPIHPSLG